jgi:hypothetical protein
MNGSSRTAATHPAVRTIAGALIALAGVARAQPAYQFISVPSFDPGKGESYLWDINELNQAVGVASKPNVIGYPPFVWSQSTGKMIVTPGWPRGISNTGWVVGVSYVQNIVTNQTFTPPTLPGTYPILNLGGVNDAGIAVGLIQTCNCSNSGGVQQIPLIWDEANGSRTVAVPNAKGLSRINNHNLAIGWLDGNASLDAFFINIDSGQHTRLGDIFPSIGSGPTRASDLNDAGQIVGTRYGDYPVYFYGYLYDPATGFEILPFPSPTYQKAVQPFGLNNAGTIVGDIFINGSSRAFVYSKAGGIRDLNDPTLVADILPGYTMMTAQKINDHGWIVGYGYGGGAGIYTGYVLKPIDAPTCQADCDHNATLTIDDFICFQTLFAIADPTADCDADGVLTIDDFICFQTLFAIGC